jgi:hypothetical protein
MATHLTADQMKQHVKDHFEDFVNNRNAGVIHKNMTRRAGQALHLALDRSFIGPTDAVSRIRALALRRRQNR